MEHSTETADDKKKNDILKEVQSLLNDDEKIRKLTKARNKITSRDMEKFEELKSNTELYGQVTDMANDPRTRQKFSSSLSPNQRMKEQQLQFTGKRPDYGYIELKEAQPIIVLVTKNKIKSEHCPTEGEKKSLVTAQLKGTNCCIMYNPQMTQKNAHATKLFAPFLDDGVSKLCGEIYFFKINEEKKIMPTSKEDLEALVRK